MSKNRVELSEIQKGIYFECQTGGKNTYNISAAIKIKNHVDISKMQQALKLLVTEQIALRSHVEYIEEKLMMVLNEETDTTIHTYDVTKEQDSLQKANDIVNQEMVYEHDLSKPPLYRVSLIKVKEEEFILVINLHHIIADGISFDIFLQKFFTYYTDLLKNKAVEVKEDQEYYHFVESENQKLVEGTYDKQKEYWIEKVKGVEVLDLARDFSSIHDNFGTGKEAVFPLSDELMKKVEKTSQNEEVTPFIFCLAAFSALMGKCCNQEDVVVSSPFSYRPGLKLDNTIGCFIYTLPLKCNVSGERSFHEMLVEMYDEMIGAYKNLGYPNNLIGREASSGVYTGMQSIFDISFVYDRFSENAWDGLDIENYESDYVTFPGNMMVILNKMPDGNRIKIQYKPDLYAAEMIENLGKRFVKVLEIVTEHPEIQVKDMNLLLEDEEQKILYDFNQSVFFEYKPTHTMDMFLERVEQYADSTALIYDGGTMTYRELNEKVNQFARQVLAYKTKNNEVIGVQLKRSKEMVIAILGILKAGCAYVPIEEYYPEQRKLYIFKDADISIFVTTKDLPSEFCKEQHVIFAEEEAIYAGDSSEPEVERSPYDLAYIEYTSGSTGEPKGVMIENHSVVNTVLDLDRRFPLEEGDVYLYKTPFSFDISGTEIYGFFAGKGALCILEHEGEKNPEMILDYIEKYNVTHINFVPSMFRLFLEQFNDKNKIEKLKPLKWMFVGGEAITPDMIDKFFDLNTNIRLENVYGPTECTMWASNYSIKEREDVTNVSIGHPLNEIRWYVIDENKNLQMIGVPGELCLSGVGLARGYLNKEELTAEKFCDNPFYNPEKDPEWFKKMYRTGDLVRWLPDGSIEFMGRIDFQVKIGGVRMELGEIENALEEHDKIVKAVVVTKQSGQQLPILCAYYLSDTEIPVAELRDFLSTRVPAYMMPSFYVKLDELPLNGSGKVDRKVLLADTSYKKHAAKIYQAPESELETKIAAIWKEVLGIDEVGIDDNFYDIGGHSLAVIQVHNKLKETLGIDFSITVLFQLPTIRLLAEHIMKDEDETIVDRKKYFTRKQKAGYCDIAIIGMAIDVPGANNISEYWNNLKNEKECIHYYSDEELRELGISDEMINNPNYVKAKGRVNDIDYFDAKFFEYTPSEVKRMSPQLRLLYKGTWEALEDAGYYPGSTDDKMGIFIGGSDDFLWYNTALGHNVNYSDMYQAFTMSTNHFLATRLAYKFNIKGPVFSSLTGCSTTLVTSHLACQSLVLGECDVAIAGGVTVELPNDGGYLYQDGMMFSPDGHCRPFDSKAKGTVFSNGCGIIVLKRLEEALEAGDHIYAVIKGSAINNDGSQKVGFAAPSVEGQAEVIQEAYKRAEVDPETVGYIEAHGTGTILGDPIEVESLTKAFATDKKDFCVLGSVKGNIGHTDTAAGVSGLIKVALSLHNKYIPGTLNFEDPNPKIPFGEIPFVINGHGQDWKVNEIGNRRAGINSFGVGGTNAHMVLEEAPKVRESEKEEKTNLLLLSAKTEHALDENMKAILHYLASEDGVNRSDAAWTLMKGRKHFKYRRAVVIGEDFGRTIDADEYIEDILESSGKEAKEKRKVYFMFSGQGNQYQGIGKDLYNDQESFAGKRFRAIVDEIFGYLNEEEKDEFYQVVYGNADAQLVNQTKYSQFALFITEYALAKIVMDLGVKPDGFIGHSIGEVTAAAVAGVWTLADAVKIVRMRGDLMQKQNPGVMLAIMDGVEKVKPLLIEGVSLALNNTSDRCVVGGTKEKIEAFEKIVKEKGIKATILRTSHAFHTYMMQGAADEFCEFLKGVKMQNPSIPIVSNVSGKWVEEDEMNKPEYWAEHIINPVQFDKDLEVVLQEDNAVYIEVGAGRSLCTFALQHSDRKDGQAFLNVVRHPKEKKDDLEYLYEKLGLLWCYGVELDWTKFMDYKVRNRISLPVYQFEKDPYPIKVPLDGSMNNGGGEEYEDFDDEIGEIVITDTDSYETLVIDIYKEVLGFAKIEADQDFFELGGDSLKAVSLCNEVKRKTGVKLSVSDIFKYGTPKKLANYLKGMNVNASAGSTSSSNRTIKPAAKATHYKTSSAQKRMYGLYLMEPDSTAYNLPSATIIEGKLDEAKVREVSDKLLARHEILRTSFEVVDNEVMQVVADKVDMDLTFETHYISTDAEMEQMIQDFVKPFDLSKPCLCRLKLVEIGENRSVLLFDVHHIIADGTSVEILTRDFNTLYVSTLEPLDIQYKDFAEWQNEYQQSDEMLKLKEYWTSIFEDDIPVLELPYDQERPEIKTFKGNRIHFTMESSIAQKLDAFNRKHGTTMYMSLLSAWYVLLARYSGQEDIVVGSPVAGRITDEVAETMGMFVNMLAMRNKPVWTKTIAEFVAEVKQNTIAALKNQNYQFDDLAAALDIRRDLSRNALFDVCFDYQNMETFDLDINGMKITPVQFDTYSSAYDMVLTCQQDNKSGKIDCFIDYASDLFHVDTMERLIKNYIAIVERMIENETQTIGALSIVSSDEKATMMKQEETTKMDVPSDKAGKTLSQLFESYVEKHPDKVAVITANGSTFTYKELNEKANKIAHRLQELQVGVEDRIGLMTKRNEYLFAGMLGILKAGAGYIPIDPNFPEERIQYMLNVSSPKAVLTDKAYENKVKTNSVIIDCEALDASETNVENVPNTARLDSLAYIIFTSGSTGNPKGVMVEQNSVINFVNDIVQRNIFEQEEDRVICVTTLSFDIFGFESLVPLCTGHSIYLADEQEQLDSMLAARKIVEHKVTHILSTVSRIKAFVENPAFAPALKQLRCVLSGGENYPIQLLKNIRDNSQAKIYNMYGPTETTIWSTSKDLTNSDVVTIGEPIINTQIYIINKERKLQPYGVYGEICIAGEGLARGYFNDQEETDSKFTYIEELPGVRIYRTGDRGRLLANGETDICGRLDDQVKIRGYRVETSEIEKAAMKYPIVSNAVVKVYEDSEQNKRLALFYCTKENNQSTAGKEELQLKEWLREKLPHYMVPDECIKLEAMPVLPNGKINKKALEITETRSSAIKAVASAKLPPKSELEKRLLAIWRDVLKKDDIGVNENFFDAGGNSLALMMMNNRIVSELKVTVPLMKLFEYPTIEGMVHVLFEETGAVMEPTYANETVSSDNASSTVSFDADDFDDDGFDDDDFDDNQGNGSSDIKKDQTPSESINYGKDDIAVIGMACRFPDANNIDEFWDNLMAGKESIRFFEKEELMECGIPEETIDKANYVRAKGYLDGVEYFDAKLFDYSEKEAQIMDPQIRLLHQCTYEVLEDAGYNSFDYDGKIGMFAGSGSNLLWMTKFGGVQNDIIEAFEAMTYNEKDFLTTKVAYKLNLKGPSMNIQTACSTSLVAIHEAARVLADGEADMAVAGGVCISYPRKEGYLWHEGMIYSKDGHCRPFSNDSTGTVAGNGCGVVLLKPLKKALEDKDHIYAVIKGSAVNNDGIDKIGYTAPSIKGQCDVIKTALDKAKVAPEEIRFIETHGTGTSLGDPIEVEALRQAWHTDKTGYCSIGAVKANVGHLDAASGVAGFIKAVLVLDKKEIPPMINFNEPNEKLDITHSPFYINTNPEKIDGNGKKLKAAVSSFGIGGTNAHVILEEAPHGEDR